MKQYKTEIYNETDYNIDLVLDFFGKRRCTLQAGIWGYVISVWWMNYAHYSKVVYKANGEVKLHKRFNFKTQFKKDQYTLKIENQHDRILNYSINSIYFGAYKVPQGLTVEVPVFPLDPLASYEEILIKPDKVISDPTNSPVRPHKDHDAVNSRKDRFGLHLMPNLEYKKRSEKALLKLKELRQELNAEDLDYGKFYSEVTMWNREAWLIPDDLLQEPDEVEKMEKRKAEEIDYTVGGVNKPVYTDPNPQGFLVQGK